MWPYGQQPTRLLCPQDSLGKNTGVGCHFLLHEIFLIADLRSLSSKTNISTSSETVSVDFFSCVWVMLPCSFVCLTIFCWKLDIFNNVTVRKTIVLPTLRDLFCSLVGVTICYFSDFPGLILFSLCSFEVCSAILVVSYWLARDFFKCFEPVGLCSAFAEGLCVCVALCVGGRGGGLCVCRQSFKVTQKWIIRPLLGLLRSSHSSTCVCSLLNSQGCCRVFQSPLRIFHCLVFPFKYFGHPLY